MDGPTVVATVAVIQLAVGGIGATALTTLARFRRETNEKLSRMEGTLDGINGRVRQNEQRGAALSAWKESHDFLSDRCMTRFDRIEKKLDWRGPIE